MKWTAEQSIAMETEGRNLLVSAAAGSGKTAVLINRILRKLTRPDAPSSVMNLLVVTFTNAAAEEMKEKLSDAVRDAIESGAYDKKTTDHLKKQLILIERADVCTIDSFCLRLVRSEVHLSTLDPAFRIGDRGEIALLETDVLADVMEEEYVQNAPDFVALTEYFAGEKAESGVEDQVSRLYRFMRNAADPEKWLDHCLDPFRIKTTEELDKAGWNQRFLARMSEKKQALLQELHRLTERMKLPGGASVYLPSALELQAALEKERDETKYESFRELSFELLLIAKTRLPILKKKDGDPDLQEKTKVQYKAFRESVEDFANAFPETAEGAVKDLAEMRPAAEALVRLTKRFSDSMKEAKKEKQIVDFNDVEHEALSLLHHDGEPSEAAKRLSARYEEILIDEYQDSSELQEAILTAVARRKDGKCVNVFMVGDMKQSIYRFRMADPGLFIKKYDTYPLVQDAAALAGKVELRANFRSRAVVTDAANFFFRALMQREVDGVGYDKAAELDPKRVFPDVSVRSNEPSELIVVDTTPKSLSPEEPIDPADPNSEAKEDAPEAIEATPDAEEDAPEKTEAEARVIAEEILKLTDEKNPLYIADKKHEGKMRPVTFSDIVILTRSLKNVDRVFTEVLESYGIPCYAEQKTGFYDTFEIRFLMNYLSVIDNPVNDTALYGTLHSAFFNLTAEELSAVRIASDKAGTNGFYGAVTGYAESKTNETAAKLRDFLIKTERFRLLSHEIPLSRLIRMIVSETGMEAFVGAMPGGRKRLGNVRFLITKASDFEKTSYRGIFNFLRYTARKKEIEEDEGEVSDAGSEHGPVRLLTIHASKGLQYPVVFVAGLGKQFNQQDERETIVMHASDGFAMDLFRFHVRMKKKTYLKQAFKTEIRSESMGEEIRDLYVAMTRAEEKLYLTGTMKNATDLPDSMRERWSSPEQFVTPSVIRDAKTYLSLLLQAYKTDAPAVFSVRRAAPKKEAEIAKEERITLSEALREPSSGSGFKRLSDVLSYPYDYDDARRIRQTLSVSMLKNLATERDADNAIVDDLHYEGAPEMDSERDREKTLTTKPYAGPVRGAKRGTLYHFVMEHLDPTKPVAESLALMRNNHLLSKDENDTIQPERIERFLDSPIGKRFTGAFRNGRSFREKPFIISLPVTEVFPDAKMIDEEERVMIQGVIDLCFEDEKGWVIVDYKTDRVNGAAELVSRYRVQLTYYEKALTMMTGKPVAEKWIYSFHLGQGIQL